MSLRIPLPNAPAGSTIQGAAEINALKQSELENVMKGLQNKYYAPNIESEIANRNALTKGQTITNQYLPQKLALANAFSQLQNKYYAPNIMSEIASRNANTNETQTMLPLKAQELNLKNKFYPELTQAQIGAQNSLSNYRQMGGMQMGVGQKELMGLQRQLLIDHPDWDANTANQAASSYLSGSDTLPSGEKLPPLSGLGSTYIAQIQKRNSTAAVQNQAANMDVLASDVNDIDIKPVMAFAGLPGKANFAKYQAAMALGQDVPQEFRDYVAFKDVTSQFAMDALRKGFGTSVVPDYVYATLGKASHPNSTWWFDPKQVATEWNTTKDWINKNAERYKKKATQGVGASLTGSVSGASNKKATLRYNPQTGDFEEIK
jgi:hypothetical protein